MKIRVFLFSIIAIFSSCKECNFQTVANFKSTVEKNDKSAISQALLAVQNSDIAIVCHLIAGVEPNQIDTPNRILFDISKKIKLSNENETWTKSIHLCDSIINSDIKNKYLIDFIQFERLFALSNISLSYPEEYGHYEKEINDPKSEYEIIRYVNFLQLKANLLWSINQYSESLITAQYGRYLLYRDNLDEIFPKSNLDLIFIANHTLSEIKNHHSQHSINNEYLMKNYAQLGYTNNVLKTKIEQIDMLEHHSEAISKLYQLYEEFPNSKPQITSIIVKTLSWNEPNNLIENLDLYLPQLKKLKYKKGQSSGYQDIAFAYLEQGNFTKAKLYQEKMIKNVSSSPMENLWIKSYNYIFLSDYYEKLNRNSSLDSALYMIERTFHITPEIFGDDEDSHLDSYYMDLTTRYASILESKSKISHEQENQFFYFLKFAQADEIKKRNTQIKLNKGIIITKRDSLNKLLNSEIRANGDWNELLTNLSPRNETIYNLKKQLKLEPTVDLPIQLTPLKEIKNKLKESNSIIIGYINSPTAFMRFTIDSATVNFKKIDVEYLENFSYKLKENKHNYSDSLIIYDKILPRKYSTFDNIWVIPDGPINDIALTPYITKDQKIQYISDVSDILGFDKNLINKNHAAYFCFSNENTIRNKQKQKKLHPELSYSVNASHEITKNLKLDKYNIFSGFQMTKENLFNNLGNSILHISTHGFSSDSIINENSILVRSSTGYDSIHTTDLDYLEQYPTFIYLDGCNTGSGMNIKGEGTYSLSRIFAKNGVETIIKTLWPINDKSSAYFSKSYYHNWITGISAGEAFHLAQKQTKSKYPDPYDWASFVFEGNPNLYLN